MSLKGGLHVTRIALRDQHAREMGARKAVVTRDAPRLCQGFGYAGRGQALGDLLGAALALGVQSLQRALQRSIAGINGQTHHVHSVGIEGAGELDAGQQAQAVRGRSLCRGGQAVHGVVVGQRPFFDAVGGKSGHEGVDRQYPIRHIGMDVVVAAPGGPILQCSIHRRS